MGREKAKEMKTATRKCAAWSISLLTLLVALPAKAADLAYAGRLVDSEGAPLAGPVDITLRFYGSAAGSDQLGPTKTFDGVALEGGVFQLTVSLETTDQAAIFGDGTAVVFVEIEAAGKLYPLRLGRGRPQISKRGAELLEATLGLHIGGFVEVVF